uniref:(California timema) hypothetical protein n=1 Tax=Timema californicum TaxID=61474 RepID=A0A7R9J5X7_TIMCA|nr:unnamed protein product [Timema californicum]
MWLWPHSIVCTVLTGHPHQTLQEVQEASSPPCPSQRFHLTRKGSGVLPPAVEIVTSRLQSLKRLVVGLVRRLPPVLSDTWSSSQISVVAAENYQCPVSLTHDCSPMASLVLTDSSQLTSDSQYLGIYSSPVASLVLTDSSQLTSDSQHLAGSRSSQGIHSGNHRSKVSLSQLTHRELVNALVVLSPTAEDGEIEVRISVG